MRKTILYVGGFQLPDGNAAAQRVLSNAKVFSELGFDVVFLGVSSEKESKKILDTEQKIDDFIAYKENYPGGIIQWFQYLASLKNIKTVINKIGVDNLETIVAYNYPSIVLQRLLKFCNNKKIKLISDCTEWAIEPNNYSIRSILKNLDTFYRMKLVHLKLDGMIVISKFLFDFYGAKMNNVILVPPLVDISQDKWKQKAPTRNDKIVKLVYAGSPGAGNKDKLDLVINALSQIKLTFKLTIVGITEKQYLSNVKEQSLPENIKNCVIFKGRVPHLTAIEEVKNADFSVFLREDNIVTRAGFPTKFVESISCGTPVLTNASSNIRDYLDEPKFGGIINIDSEQQLVNSIKLFMSYSSDRINEMKEYCRNSRTFDFSNYINEFEKTLLNE